MNPQFPVSTSWQCLWLVWANGCSGFAIFCETEEGCLDQHPAIISRQSTRAQRAYMRLPWDARTVLGTRSNDSARHGWKTAHDIYIKNTDGMIKYDSWVSCEKRVKTRRPGQHIGNSWSTASTAYSLGNHRFDGNVRHTNLQFKTCPIKSISTYLFSCLYLIAKTGQASLANQGTLRQLSHHLRIDNHVERPWKEQPQVFVSFSLRSQQITFVVFFILSDF